MDYLRKDIICVLQCLKVCLQFVACTLAACVMNLPIHVIILDYDNNGEESCSPVLINNAESKFKNNKPVE